MVQNFKVLFKYDGPVAESMKPIYEGQFMAVRNLAVKYLNPKYERWNKEYEDSLNGREWNESEYNKFIRRKQKMVLSAVSIAVKNAIPDILITLDSDEECDIVARIDSTGAIISMYLKEA